MYVQYIKKYSSNCNTRLNIKIIKESSYLNIKYSILLVKESNIFLHEFIASARLGFTRIIAGLFKFKLFFLSCFYFRN